MEFLFRTRLRHRYLFLGISMISLLACDPKKETLFVQLDAKETGIQFVNSLTETEELNIMQYEYLYNGGGVGVGDFNSDGRADLFFTGNQVSNALYLNMGEFKFMDVTHSAGVAGKAGWKTGVTVVDVNADGRPDIYVCYSGPDPSAATLANQLFVNQGNDSENKPIFREESQRYGLDAPGTLSTQASFFDYDHDGDLDMFLLNHSKTFFSPFFNSDKLRKTRHPNFGNRLYENQNGYYVDVSEKAGIWGSGLNFGLGVIISDFNHDLYPDIYVTNDYDEQDFLYLNQKDGTYRVSLESISVYSKYSMGVDAADLDQNGWIDLMTLDMLPQTNLRQKMLKGPDQYDRYQLAVENGYQHQQMRNMVHLNQGILPNGTPLFSEVGQMLSLHETDWSWSVLMADYDNNGQKDVFITNGYWRDYTNQDFIKYDVNEAVEQYRAGGNELFSTQGKQQYKSVIFDLVKKMPSSQVPNQVFQNTGKLNFLNASVSWGLDQTTSTHGAAYVDLDEDGDLDLVTSTLNAPIGIFKNRTQELQPQNYVRITLKGDAPNTTCIGAKIWVITDSSTYLVENQVTRGFQSSVDPVLHWGLGKQKIQSIKIQWPDGQYSYVQAPRVNSRLVIEESKSTKLREEIIVESRFQPWLTEITFPKASLFKHESSEAIDFMYSPLTWKQFNKSGPVSAVGDVNGDGEEDMFIGGPFGKSDVLWVSGPSGYHATVFPDFERTKSAATTGAVFFDVDLDGDLDLYVASGGAEIPEHDPRLQDRLFLNDGTGFFTLDQSNSLPSTKVHSGIVIAQDYDHDGDLDILIGGNVTGFQFPQTTSTRILRNEYDRAKKKLAWKEVTNTIIPQNIQGDLVTKAAWKDINGDQLIDLIWVGEFSPIRILIQQKDGSFENQSERLGLKDTHGIWQNFDIVDLDQDGDLDILAGNIGQNLPYKTSIKQPLEVFGISHQGKMIPILAQYEAGNLYPIASLDELQLTFPEVRKKFLKYKAFGQARISDLFTQEQLKNSLHRKAQTLESTIFWNENGKFRAESLPKDFQISSARAIAVHDFNLDGNLDILIAGNTQNQRVQTGPLMASYGTGWVGLGKGKFRLATRNELGFWLPGPISDLKKVTYKNQTRWIFLLENQPGRIFHSQSGNGVKSVKL